MYQHIVQYYETDKMGITHHSNYIRWMEEARIAFLDDLGYGYDRLEKEGIVSPVIGVECTYKKPSTFKDVINIDAKVEEFKGVRLVIAYTMKNQQGDLVALGKSQHCFLNTRGIPVRLQREYPEFYDLLMKSMETKEEA